MANRTLDESSRDVNFFAFLEKKKKKKAQILSLPLDGRDTPMIISSLVEPEPV